MKRTVVYIMFLVGLTAHAQTPSLPVIPDDPSVVVSTLPCGMRLYYVPVLSSGSILNLALVQKVDSITCEGAFGMALKATENAAFHSVGVGKFLSSNGVLPGKNGRYFHETDPSHNIIYRIDSLSLDRGATVLDSTLFCLFSIARESAVGGGIPTSSQALVAVGDITYEKLSAKLGAFSLLCPKVSRAVVEKKYEWKAPSPGEWKIRTEEGNVGKVVAEWRDAHIPDKYMKTVLPTISSKLSGEFGWALKGRLYPEFRRQGMHVWMNYSFVGSADSQGDEISRIEIYCPKNLAVKAGKILETELDRLMTYGVGMEEYRYYREAYRYSVLRDEESCGGSAEKEMRKCISHFLCGSSLATDKEMMSFEFRQMPDSTQTRLFNNYVRKRLSVGSRTDSSLTRQDATVPMDSMRRILSSYIPALAVKMPREKTEHLGQATRWNIPSGPVAIHKKTSGGSSVRYCYAVKGGSRWADMDYLTCIDAVPSEALALFLSANGADMNVDISPACVYFSGSVPQENLEAVISVLAAISRQHENEKLFSADRYKLLVTAGPVSDERMKGLLAKYAGAFGPGTDVAVGVDMSDVSSLVSDDAADLPPGTVRTRFPFDMCSENYALSRIARLILRDRIAAALCDSGVTARLDCSFENYPMENYRIGIIPSKEGYADTLVSVLESLSGETLDGAALKMYRKLALNEFTVCSSTPGYYIEAAVRRYIDFKDLYSNFQVNVEKTGAADLKDFFTAALANVSVSR